MCIAFACTVRAQIYQVGPDASKKPQAQSSPTGQAQQGGQNLGWGSNIQNARLARAAELALQKGDHAQASIMRGALQKRLPTIRSCGFCLVMPRGSTAVSRNQSMHIAAACA